VPCRILDSYSESTCLLVFQVSKVTAILNQVNLLHKIENAVNFMRTFTNIFKWDDSFFANFLRISSSKSLWLFTNLSVGGIFYEIHLYTSNNNFYKSVVIRSRNIVTSVLLCQQGSNSLLKEPHLTYSWQPCVLSVIKNSFQQNQSCSFWKAAIRSARVGWRIKLRHTS